MELKAERTAIDAVSKESDLKTGANYTCQITGETHVILTVLVQDALGYPQTFVPYPFDFRFNEDCLVSIADEFAGDAKILLKHHH